MKKTILYLMRASSIHAFARYPYLEGLVVEELFYHVHCPNLGSPESMITLYCNRQRWLFLFTRDMVLLEWGQLLVSTTSSNCLKLHIGTGVKL